MHQDFCGVLGGGRRGHRLPAPLSAAPIHTSALQCVLAGPCASERPASPSPTKCNAPPS